MKKFSHDDLIEILRLRTQEELSSRAIADRMGCGKSSINSFLAGEYYKEFWENYNDEKPVAHGEISPPETKRLTLTGKKYIITSAQNNTFVHDQFLKSLETYAEFNDAEILVSTFHYNKTGFQNGSSDDVWFDPKIRKYIIDQPAQVAGDLVFCGELNILPTAVNPLSGLQSYTGISSAIIPHAKMQMESVPTPKYDDPKFLYTTGTVTQRNYIQMKSGQKAEFDHVFGALIVEIDEDGDWFVRQLNAESGTGCFYDLDAYYTPEGVFQSDRIEAINYGDIHVANLNEEVADVSWRLSGTSQSILDSLKPKYQFLHDVLDQRARNHHDVGNPHKMFEKFVKGTGSVYDEVLTTGNEIKNTIRPWSTTIVVNSNHDEALGKWLIEQDYKRDPVNAVFFLELQLAKYKAIHNQDEDFHLFEYAVKNNINGVDNVKFLRLDESFRICDDIECGQHGHNGVNGSRGSFNSFLKQGIKFNVGHSHSAGIKSGVYYAGVSGKLDAGYNVGGSSWSHSHIITYENGKRAIITIKNGKWKGD